jgi:hypothetical protein
MRWGHRMTPDEITPIAESWIKLLRRKASDTQRKASPSRRIIRQDSATIIFYHLGQGCARSERFAEANQRLESLVFGLELDDTPQTERAVGEARSAPIKAGWQAHGKSKPSICNTSRPVL